ncbi:carboxymuconolactone decarboxylase family protein [candidate division KSB1 bacterium]|nr:carboxymuconolactone decarboxylase family protein [candidate division KSB1 bacterium]
MRSADRAISSAQRHPDYETLIYLTALSVMWLTPQNPEAKRLLEHYRDRQLDQAALREAALQLLLLAGFQTSLEAFFQIHEVFNATLTGDPRELEESFSQVWLHRGYDLQAKVYAGSVEKLRTNLLAISPELEAWTVMVGYGLVMSRPGLPPHWRELLEIAALAVQGFPRQLHSHIRGALNLGATHDEVELVLHTVEGWLDEPHRAEIWRLWKSIK